MAKKYKVRGIKSMVEKKQNIDLAHFSPIVSSEHLASPGAWQMSEFEYGLNVYLYMGALGANRAAKQRFVLLFFFLFEIYKAHIMSSKLLPILVARDFLEPSKTMEVS